MLIRTDRSQFAALRSSGLVAVDSPQPGELTIEWRPAGPNLFLEVVSLAKVRAATSCRRLGLDPTEIVAPAVVDGEGKVTKPAETAADEIERVEVTAMLARAAIVRVHGAPDDLAAQLSAAPASVYDFIGPTAAAQLGGLVFEGSVSPDPFVRPGSGR